MLKPDCIDLERDWDTPAAFRRLCVETVQWVWQDSAETQPPSGGCVLKQSSGCGKIPPRPSRLQAAVC